MASKRKRLYGIRKLWRESDAAWRDGMGGDWHKTLSNRPHWWRRIGMTSQGEVLASAIGLFIIVILLIFLLTPDRANGTPHPPDPCAANAGFEKTSEPRWERKEWWIVDMWAWTKSCDDNWPIVDHGVIRFHVTCRGRYRSTGLWGGYVSCFWWVSLPRRGENYIEDYGHVEIYEHFDAVQFRLEYGCGHWFHDTPAGFCSDFPMPTVESDVIECPKRGVEKEG